MKRRVISLWLPRLPTDRLLRRGGARRDKARAPLVTVAETGGRFLVAAVARRAEAAGLAPGMTLADARAVAPAVDAVPADPAADAALLDRLVAWCGRYTPWAAADGLDGVFLDVAGCAHLFGGEAALCGDLARRLEGQGFTARAAMADTPGAAWAVARYGGGSGNGAVVAPGGANDALAPLPVAALRLDAATAAGLARVGVRRIGELRDMPRAPLAARFGAGVARRLDQAFGAVREPISPRAPVAPFRARIAFAEPIALVADIERGLLRLLDDLCRRLADAGRGARRLVLTLYRVDGEVFETRVGAARPACHADRLARLFAGRLGGFDPGFGIEAMTLAAAVSEPLAPARTALLVPPRGAAGEGGAVCADELAPLIDRLGNRIGFERVVRLAARASHVPERAVRAMPALAGAADFTWSPDAPLPPRPLRLLEPPEPIEAAAPPDAPEAPPARFRWRRADHLIRAAEGPERIAPEWWLGAETGMAGTRDYWRVEATDGRRFWIYRHGLPHRDRPAAWFLHGLFA